MKPLINKLALLILTVLTVSCSNDSDSETPHEMKANRIVKEISENTTKTFAYNDQNQLIKIIEIGKIDAFGVTQSVKNYTYENGKVVQAQEDYTGSTSFTFRYMYGYDSEGRVYSMYVQKRVGSENYNDFTDIVFDYTTPNVIKLKDWRMDGNTSISILDVVNGNITTNSVYTNITNNNPNGVLNYTSLYSNYDTKKSPYESLPLIYNYPYSSANNLGKYESSGTTITYTYEYNADGYPVKKTSSFDNKSIIYEYERI